MTQERPTRKGDGGTYILVAKECSEFPVSLRYAATLAASRRASLSIIAPLTLDEFTNWSGVEDRLQAEESETLKRWIQPHIDAITEKHGLVPELIIKFGNPVDTILETVTEHTDAMALVIAASKDAKGPGHLVDYFSGKGIRRLPVPLVIIPEELPESVLETLA